MSGNSDDRSNQGDQSPPDSGLPPAPKLPPLPWEEGGDAPQHPAAAPGDPAAQQPNPYTGTPDAAPQNSYPGAPSAQQPAQPVDPYAARAAQTAQAGADPYAAQQPPAGAQQGYGQIGGQPGYGQQPGYAPQPGFLPGPQQPPKRKRGWIGWAIGGGLVVILAGGWFIADSMHLFDGRGEETAEGADFALSDAGPTDIAYAWNTDGVTSGEWEFSRQDATAFESSKEGQTCSFVGYTAPAAELNLPDGPSDAASDTEASAADFNAYLDSLEANDPSIDSQTIEEAGTVALESSAGTIEFQAYNVDLDWTDDTVSVTKERWYWRTFADTGTTMHAYVSCGLDNISDEIESMRELTVD
ncbi:hypothetical protein [Microbacterium halotolerans]|uniref:hypothetical protein n=1 Tax=Microbacterium halotolerans TaxID=246613 RepID=UPI000E6AB7E1|nr:hypothetical protein [Microbacterium halotolerans]